MQELLAAVGAARSDAGAEAACAWVAAQIGFWEEEERDIAGGGVVGGGCEGGEGGGWGGQGVGLGDC